MIKAVAFIFLMVLSPLASAEATLFDVLIDRIRSSLGITTSDVKVIRIADGDTLTVLKDRTQIKIRLGEIDAPESKQAYGKRSKESLEQLCAGKYVTYEKQDTDRYGRVVARVTCDGIDANRTQVERGMAWVYTKYNDDGELLELELRAKAERRGLWADPGAMPPWEWRKQSRQK